MADFSVAGRIIDIDGTTVVLDLNNQAGGYTILSPAQMLGESWRRITTSSPYVHGTFTVAEALDAGLVSFEVKIAGSSWIQVETRRLAMRTAWITRPKFYLELAIQGVTTRYLAERPEVAPLETASESLIRKVRIIGLTFPVQPSETTTGV